jgi:hypothetical protein
MVSERETQQIAVVYETAASREHAVRFCAQLSDGFRFDAGPEAHWWSFKLLSQPGAGNEAAWKASIADLIVFATSAEEDLPRAIKLWIENWLGKRGEREGALVSLMERRERDPLEVPPFKEIYLRHIAHRAGMDFFSQVPPMTISKALPDSLDSFNDRAGQMTSTLDEILHAYPSTPQMSLIHPG